MVTGASLELLAGVSLLIVPANLISRVLLLAIYFLLVLSFTCAAALQLQCGCFGSVHSLNSPGARAAGICTIGLYLLTCHHRSNAVVRPAIPRAQIPDLS